MQPRETEMGDSKTEVKSHGRWRRSNVLLFRVLEGRLAGSVGRTCDSWSQGHEFKFQGGCGDCSINKTKICRALGEEKEENMTEALFERIMLENIPEPVKEADPRNQVAQEPICRTRNWGGGSDTEMFVVVQVRADGGWDQGCSSRGYHWVCSGSEAYSMDYMGWESRREWAWIDRWMWSLGRSRGARGRTQAGFCSSGYEVPIGHLGRDVQ